MSESAQQGQGDASAIDRKFMDLYSRQIGTYGMDTMVRLISLKVLVLGCRGVGAEAAKNLALAGVHTVGLFDPAVCASRDQGANFCVYDEHISKGATRAQATHDLVVQLNPNTRIRVEADASEATIQGYDVVIATTGLPTFSRNQLVRLNDACRANKANHNKVTSFVVCYSCGANGSVFVDHGAGFVTKDPDGGEALQKSRRRDSRAHGQEGPSLLPVATRGAGGHAARSAP